jgi:hypothetical protein
VRTHNDAGLPDGMYIYIPKSQFEYVWKGLGFK